MKHHFNQITATTRALEKKNHAIASIKIRMNFFFADVSFSPLKFHCTHLIEHETEYIYCLLLSKKKSFRILYRFFIWHGKTPSR